MQRRTKIVTTLGPATDDPQILEQLLLAGANVVRLNFSHGDPDDHRRRVAQVQALATKHKLNIGILGDLQGPKIRVARFENGSVTLENGETIVLDSQWPRDKGTAERVGVDYEDLAKDCQVGDTLLLDDGRIVFEVTERTDSTLTCQIISGGTLSNHKGINKQGGGLSAPALTDKDLVDIQLAAELDVDFLAVSFPRTPDDLNQARTLHAKAGGNALIVAKIERAEVVECDEALDAMLEAADVIMVARGDLAVEIGDPALAGAQKHMVKRARMLGVPVITATQMMESMIEQPSPTRAEVMDVANAVIDGTDAVMLSAETASGQYPVETVQSMSAVIQGAERYYHRIKKNYGLERQSGAIDEAIAMAAVYTAHHFDDLKALVCLSESGNTPKLMSRVVADLPLFAFVRHAKIARRVSVLRGVRPVIFEPSAVWAEVFQATCHCLKAEHGYQVGDKVLITKGDAVNVGGGTNTLKLLEIT